MPVRKLVQDLSRLSQRDIVRKTVETYPNSWIVVQEILQNALDAIQKSGRTQGKVKVQIDLDNRIVEVYDNGIGFPFNLQLLGFGTSGKGAEDWSVGGEMGVGLKVVIFSTENFSIDAVYIDQQTGQARKWDCRITNGWKYVQGTVDDIDVDYSDPAANGNETYSRIRYVFPNSDRLTSFLQEIYDKYLASGMIQDDLAQSELDKLKLALEHYFRTEGYAANVNNLMSSAQGSVTTDIEIKILCGDESSKLFTNDFQSLLVQNRQVELSFKNRFWNIQDAVERTRRGVSRPTILTAPFPDQGGEIGNYNQNYVYVQEFPDWASFKRLLQNQRMRSPPNPEDFKPFFDRYIIGAYVVVGARETLKKHLIGVYRLHPVAASGIPSAHDIHVPSDVGALGFVNNIHFIINLRARLSYGKQTIKNPWLLGQVNGFFKDAFRSTLMHTAQSITGVVEAPPPPITIPVSSLVSRPDLEVPSLSVKKEPVEEMELIALFYELAGKGYISDYETWSLTSKQVFDGKFLIRYPGVQIAAPHSDNDLSNIEFKVKLGDLIDDFDQGRKNPSELKLIIVWENDFQTAFPSGHTHFELVDIQGTEMEEYCLNYVQECLHDRRDARKIQILELKKAMSRIREQIQEKTAAN